MVTMLWIVVAGVLLVVELHSGTVYLLALSLAAALAGIVALFTDSLPAQFTVAAVGGAVGAYIAQGVRERERKRQRPPVTEEAGQTVVVVRDSPAIRVSWRGTEWDAVLADASTAAKDERLTIVRQEGNRLVLTR